MTDTDLGVSVQMEQWYKSPGGLIIPTIEIPLTRGYVTRLYEADRSFLDGHNWHVIVAPNTAYACTRIGGKPTYLHSLLCPEWDEVDHADGDGLNNCRHNLRDGTGFRNNANTRMKSGNSAGFKGVFRAASGNYVARIGFNKKQIYLGIYGTPGEAADAYDEAAVRYFGEYAKTNAMLGQVEGRAGEERVARPRRGRGPSRNPRTHCSAGHKYTPENTYVGKNGQRACRQCATIAARERRNRTSAPNPRAHGKICPPGCTCGRHRRAA